MKNDNDESKTEGFKDQAAQNALHSLKAISVSPSPYLTKRILNNLDSQNEARSQPSFWQQFKFWPSFSVALATLLISFVLIKKPVVTTPEPQAYLVGQAYVIRMDIRPLPKNEIAYAEISLNDDKIQFSSEKYADLKLQKKLVVNWNALVEKQYLPIVVQGVKAGSSKVLVHFYDSEHKLVTSQEISLYFKAGA